MTRAGGRVVLVGLASDPGGVDWTPIWLREVEIRGSMAYADDVLDGVRDSSIAHAVRLMAERRVDLGWLVTHRFALTEYRKALETVTAKGAAGSSRRSSRSSAELWERQSRPKHSGGPIDLRLNGTQVIGTCGISLPSIRSRISSMLRPVIVTP